MRWTPQLLAIALCLPTIALAQTTRAETLEQQRSERAKQLETYKPGGLEKLFLNADEGRLQWLIAPHNGFFAGYGYTYKPSGAGFALGGGFRHDLPNPAFREARPEDRFWAARIVAALTDEAVAAVVRAAQYTDLRVTEYVTTTLLERRAKVLGTWLNATNPIVNVAMSRSGELTFENAAERAGVAKSAERYHVQWSRFDNTTGVHHPIGDELTVTSPRADAPAALASDPPEYVSARLRAVHPDQPGWAGPVVAYWRRAADGWSLVGLERNP